LEHSGYEVFWLDVQDDGETSHKIPWVTQIKKWRLKWDYPFRQTIKKKLPFFYKALQSFNERHIVDVLSNSIKTIKPDIVHCFEMQLTGFSILPVMQQNTIPFIYSSWGSDVYYYKNRGTTDDEVKRFINRVDVLISDCRRDVRLLTKLGFKKASYVFPGNGGISIDTLKIMPLKERDILLFKGYQYDSGEALQIVKAIEILPFELIKNIEFHVYSADKEIEDYIKKSKVFKYLTHIVHPRNKRLKNTKLLELMGKSIIHLGNNLSDGMPNSLLEAMGMGAFPIQSNPGNATSEVVKHGNNGFLIENPLDFIAISKLIELALVDVSLRQKAQDYNISFIENNYNRSTLRPEIVELYKSVL
jgi:glycosyltransferase involved in cell wall biosynthesis